MDTKPGWATTEFWVTILTGVLAAAVIVNSNLDSNKLSALIPTAALVMAGVASWAYSHSRAKVKVAAVEANSTGTTVGSINVSNDAGMTVVELCYLVIAVAVAVLALVALGWLHG